RLQQVDHEREILPRHHLRPRDEEVRQLHDPPRPRLHRLLVAAGNEVPRGDMDEVLADLGVAVEPDLRDRRDPATDDEGIADVAEARLLQDREVTPDRERRARRNPFLDEATIAAEDVALQL